ncbi:MAG: hypothetical protein Kow00108_02700 [Calditrichia bacterium]
MELLSIIAAILLALIIIKIFVIALQLFFGILLLPFRLLGSLIGIFFVGLILIITFSSGLLGILLGLLSIFAPILIIGIIIMGIIKLIF